MTATIERVFDSDATLAADLGSMGLKRCAVCQTLKPIDEFYRAQTRDGRRGNCKACQKRQVMQGRRFHAVTAEWGIPVASVTDGLGRHLTVRRRGCVLRWKAHRGITGGDHTWYTLAWSDETHRTEAGALAELAGEGA